MASVVGSEVEINDVSQLEIQQIEIEEIPVELSTETVVSSDNVEDMENILTLQSFQNNSMLIQNPEEIIDPMDSNLVYVDSIQHNANGIEVMSEGIRRKTKRPNRINRAKPYEIPDNNLDVPIDDYLTLGNNVRKWEQKQVQIKTLEGEFSVTMWASGKFFTILFNILILRTDKNRTHL